MEGSLPPDTEAAGALRTTGDTAPAWHGGTGAIAELEAPAPANEAPRRALYPVGEAPPLGHVPARMHAWTVRPERYGTPTDALRVEVVDTPAIGADEVLVYVMAAGINYNNVWAALGHPLDVIAFRRREGAAEGFHIGGCDASGIVWKTGERVEHLRVGDEVVLHGGVWDAGCPVLRITGDPVLSPTFRAWGYEVNWGSFAQFARAQAHQCLPRPTHLTWEESAAYMTSLTTAHRMLHRWPPHTVRADDVVLVWGGAGGLGCMGVQLARVAGARPVAVVSADERVEFCRRLGAVGCVDRRDFEHWGAMPACDAAGHSRFVEGARAFLEAVRAAADADARPRIVLEHPGRDTLATSVFVCAPGGMVVTCAGTSGYEGSFDLRYLWTRQKRLQGSHGMDDLDARCANELVSRGLVDPGLGRAFRWNELDVPHQLMYENRHPAGNMAVLVGAPGFGTGATGRAASATSGAGPTRAVHAHHHHAS